MTTEEIKGDLSVGRNITSGGDAHVRGSATINRDLKVEGWIDAPNLRTVNKGLFSSEETLRRTYPSPRNGWYAFVGSSFPAAVYVAENNRWFATGGRSGNAEINLTEINNRLNKEEKERSDEDVEIKALIRGNSDESNAVHDPFIRVTDFQSFSEFHEWLDNVSFSTNNIKLGGEVRCTVNGVLYNVHHYVNSFMNSNFMQVVYGRIYFDRKTERINGGGNRFATYSRLHQDGKWTRWQLDGDRIIDLGITISVSEAEIYAARYDICKSLYTVIIRFASSNSSVSGFIITRRHGDTVWQRRYAGGSIMVRKITGVNGGEGHLVVGNWQLADPTSLTYDEQRHTISFKDLSGSVFGSAELPFATNEKDGLLTKEGYTLLNEELDNRMRGTSENSNGWIYPFIKGPNWRDVAEMNDGLNSMSISTKNGNQKYVGNVRCYLGSAPLLVRNTAINYLRDVFEQTVSGLIVLDGGGTLQLSYYDSFSTYTRQHKEDGTWSSWRLLEGGKSWTLDELSREDIWNTNTAKERTDLSRDVVGNNGNVIGRLIHFSDTNSVTNMQVFFCSGYELDSSKRDFQDALSNRPRIFWRFMPLRGSIPNIDGESVKSFTWSKWESLTDVIVSEAFNKAKKYADDADNILMQEIEALKVRIEELNASLSNAIEKIESLESELSEYKITNSNSIGMLSQRIAAIEQGGSPGGGGGSISGGLNIKIE